MVDINLQLSIREEEREKKTVDLVDKVQHLIDLCDNADAPSRDAWEYLKALYKKLVRGGDKCRTPLHMKLLTMIQPVLMKYKEDADGIDEYLDITAEELLDVAKQYNEYGE